MSIKRNATIIKKSKPNPMDNKKNKERLQKIDAVLEDFRNSKSLRSGFQKLALQDIWAEVMGANVAALTIKVSLQGTTLHVQLQSTLLREELRFGTEKIIAQMNTALGNAAVQNIRWI